MSMSPRSARIAKHICRPTSVRRRSTFSRRYRGRPRARLCERICPKRVCPREPGLMQTPPPSVDPDAVQVRLRQLLFELLAKNGANSFGSAQAIPNDVELSTVGLNSIDFLDFALSVEQEFGVEILDTIEPND